MHVPAPAFVAKLRENGMIAVGATENVVRLLPPLIVDENHLHEATALIGQTCAAFETERQAV